MGWVGADELAQSINFIGPFVDVHDIRFGHEHRFADHTRPGENFGCLDGHGSDITHFHMGLAEDDQPMIRQQNHLGRLAILTDVGVGLVADGKRQRQAGVISTTMTIDFQIE